MKTSKGVCAEPPASTSAQRQLGSIRPHTVAHLADRPVETAASDQEIATRLAELPREAGWLLITAGTLGVVVPGIIGTPFLVAGAVALAPGGHTLMSRWAGRNPPKLVRSAMRQMERFLDDLDRRYPRRELENGRRVGMRRQPSQVK